MVVYRMYVYALLMSTSLQRVRSHSSNVQCLRSCTDVVPCTDPVLITAHSRPMHHNLLIMIFSVTFSIKIKFLFNTILLYHNRPASVNLHFRFVLHNV